MSDKPQTLIHVVEDDAAVSRLITATLERFGYRHAAFSTGGDFLRQLRVQVPDVAILDLGLPDMDGMEVLQQLRSRYRFGLLIATGRDDTHDRVMGFSKSYKETVSKTVTVPFEASNKGGTKSVTVDIPVEINLHFNTDPFSESVKSCENDITLLTAAVVATEEVEVRKKGESSLRVADSIVNGFFSYIRSEISQQVTELVQVAESKQIVLRELIKRSASVKNQMGKDYNRISSRYMKIFLDLNKELSYRIYELNKYVFNFESDTNNHKVRALSSDLISIIAIFGAECGNLISKISSSVTKKRAYDTITKAKNFILTQKRLYNAIQTGIINENKSGEVVVPVCFIESYSNVHSYDRRVYPQEYLTKMGGTEVWNDIIMQISSEDIKWEPISPQDKSNINLYFEYELEKRIKQGDPHSFRVRETIRKIANLDSIYVMSKR